MNNNQQYGTTVLHFYELRIFISSLLDIFLIQTLTITAVKIFSRTYYNILHDANVQRAIQNFNLGVRCVTLARVMPTAAY